MISIDFELLSEEFIALLGKEQSIVLATSEGQKVTARTMSHVNDGLDIYFQTGNTSEKFKQIKANPRIAFAIGNMQIEAIAEILKHPQDNPHFINLYKAKFPQYYNLYTNSEDEVLIKAAPTKAAFYKYIDGKPCKDTLDLKTKKAYRE